MTDEKIEKLKTLIANGNKLLYIRNFIGNGFPFATVYFEAAQVQKIVAGDKVNYPKDEGPEDIDCAVLGRGKYVNLGNADIEDFITFNFIE